MAAHRRPPGHELCTKAGYRPANLRRSDPTVFIILAAAACVCARNIPASRIVSIPEMSVPVELAATGRPEASVLEIQAGRIAALPVASAAELRPSTLAGRPLRTIDVIGVSEWRVAPDHAVLNLTIETYALSAHQSAAQNAALARRVGEVLTEQLERQRQAAVRRLFALS